jgi:hypothetical protein
MGGPLGDRTERPQPVEASAADDEQICVRRRSEERSNWFIMTLRLPDRPRRSPSL